MKEFLLLFRNEPMSDKPSPEQLQKITKPWQDWIAGIAVQGQLSDRGNRLDFGGATVRPGGVVTDGPYAEIKEIMLGYIMVKVSSLENAIDLAKGCPLLTMGGNVEVRGVVEMDM